MDELLKLFSAMQKGKDSGLDMATLLPLFTSLMNTTQKKDVDKPTPKLSEILKDMIEDS